MIVSNYAIKFRVAVFVMTAVLVIAGVKSYRRLPREGTPDITIPYVFVSAFYEGTAPGEMEKLVTIPLEKSINGVEGIKELRSTTGEGTALLSIECVAGEDIDVAKQRVKDKVDLAKQDLPRDLDEPVVFAFNFSSDIPVLIFALSGQADPVKLKSMAEDLQTEIERLPGVREAPVSGTREREIRVEFDQARLAAYDIPTGLVLQRIAGENRTISAGNIEMGGSKFQVRVPGEFELASELSGILLAERAGGPVYLRDIATVTDTFKDLESISRLNGVPSVSISVKKRSGENAVALVKQVRAVVERFRLPPDVKLTVVMDQSEYVDMMLKELENNIASGFILVVIVLFVFMGMLNSLFVAIAIPMSMLLTFVIMDAWGYTLNMIVLFSLVLASGMLVDNGIVIVENTYRNRNNGLSREEASRRGAGEVAWPVITSTLTTVVAFWPLLYWPNIMGQFMSFLPVTLILTLSCSLFVALVINPAMCSFWIRPGKRFRGADGPAPAEHGFLRAYEAFLRGAIRNRIPVLLLGLAVLVFTVILYAWYGAGFELFPETQPRNATISLRFPQGTSIERTDEAIRKIEAKLPKYGDIEFSLATVGGIGDEMQSASGTHLGQIYVEFKDAAERRTNSTDLVAAIRRDVGVIPGVEAKVEKERMGPPTGSPISIELSGDDFDTLSQLSGRIIRSIQTVPGLVDLQDDFEEALPEIRVSVDRHRAALMGLDTDTVGRFLRTSLYGLETSKFRSGQEEYDITLRLPAAQRNTVDVLDRTFIPVAGGASVPLSSVCQVGYHGGRGAITRKDLKRAITISGSNQDRAVDQVLHDVRERVASVKLPRGYQVTYAGDNQEMVESGAFLQQAFWIAVGLILIILVIQFNSAVLPAIIGVSIILSIAGVMWGLLICNMRFSVVMTGLGVISLAGVVVNNSIVLVDCMRQMLAEGLSIEEAVVAAGKRRLRPVLLTAGTTVLGLIPMAVGWSVEFHEWPPRFAAGAESSSWWAPMAVAVIFGLGAATLLTLVQVPVMCTMAEHTIGRAKRFLRLDAG